MFRADCGPCGLTFVKMFRADCGTQNFLITLSVTIFFFHDVHLLLNAVTFVSEMMAIFLQLILLANTAAFGCYLLGLVSPSF